MTEIGGFMSRAKDLVGIIEEKGQIYCPACQKMVKADAQNKTSMADHGRCFDCQKDWQTNPGNSEDENESLSEKKGKLFYVHNSSIFDNKPYYQKEPIAKALKDAGFTDIHFENAYGWSNQPEVVVFRGDPKEAEKVLMDAGDDIHPLIKKYGVIIHDKDWKKSEGVSMRSNRSKDIIKLAEEDTSSYFVLADPKEADKIVKSGKDDKALFKGTADDASKYAKEKLSGKEAVMLQRDNHGKYTYAVGSDDKNKTKHESKTGGNGMSRAKDLQTLVESASQNEMYALGADHIVNWLKKVAYERFDVDPATISVVPWPQDGSDFNINSPLSKEQYEELSEKITRTYPLYVVEFAGEGLMKFYSNRTVGTEAANTEEIYPRDNMLP